jgi:hypothetical protein
MILMILAAFVGGMFLGWHSGDDMYNWVIAKWTQFVTWVKSKV